MVGTMNAIKAGLVLGILIGGWHLCWAILVASGLAQPIIDFIFWMHFIKPVFTIEPFETLKAAVLVVLAGGLGFAVGAASALVWNPLHKT